MDKIDRRGFVPDDFKDKAYLDNAIPILKTQTISQPSTVARMISLLKLKKGDSVLEIGTGSGWNASLISYIVKPGKVLSLEIYKELINNSKNNIKNLNLKNLEIKNEDFREIKEKFDKIIFSAGISKEDIIVDFVRSNLKENGILVCPYRSGPLIIIKKIKDKIKKEYSKEEYVFVPLLLD
jgi:protein-L-isoaspartate(D-aspartate) O-methyltransferase